MLLYLAAKLIAYSAWCYLGMRLFRSPRLFHQAYTSTPNVADTNGSASPSIVASVRQALGLGFFRLVIGAVFGFVAVLIGGALFHSFADPFDEKVLTYFVFLIPVRSLEWWITSKIVGKTAPSPPVIFWVFGGVVLSCLADIPASFGVVDMFSGLC